MRYVWLLIFALMSFTAVAAECPMHAEHSHKAMNQRGDQVMGFSHEKATHRFTLLKNGGRIEVTANDPQDAVTIEHIQMHLEHIAAAFASGDFQMPHDIHFQ